MLSDILVCLGCKKNIASAKVFYSCDSGPDNSIEAVCSEDCFRKIEVQRRFTDHELKSY
jgi:hypothetical protein